MPLPATIRVWVLGAAAWQTDSHLSVLAESWVTAVQYGELMAIASMQQLLGKVAESSASLKRAEALQVNALLLLWDKDLQFLGTFKTQPPHGWRSAAPNSRCSAPDA